MVIFLPRPVRLNPRTREVLGVHEHPVWKPGDDHTYQDAVFDVPADVSEERVQFNAPKYRNKFGDLLELQGFTVLGLAGPTRDGSVVGIGVTDPDRRRYRICAAIRRRPETFTTEVSDEDVGIYLKAGYELKD